MSKQFKLDKVINTKKPNDCPDCKRRVETYIKNVEDWQRHYDALLAQAEAMARSIKNIDPSQPNLNYQIRRETLNSWQEFLKGLE